MIQSKPTAVLHINKLSVILASSLLILLWMSFKSNELKRKYIPVELNSKQSEQAKYLKKTINNPFSSAHSESPSNDLLPTITAYQSEIPEFSSLHIKLHGIVFQQNQHSYAMISQQGAIQEIYQANDQIAEGLYLTKITQKQVELDFFGQQFVLGIDNSRSSTSSAVETNTQDISLFEFEQQNEILDVDKQRNPIRLFMIRRPFAVYSNGEFQGYKIMPGSNEDQFKRLGFKSGDIITYLNGEAFTGPGMKEFVIEQLTHAMHIDLIVLRDNQELSITYGF